MVLGLEQSGWNPSVLCHLLLTKSIVFLNVITRSTPCLLLWRILEVAFWCLSHVVTALFNIEESVVFEFKETCLPLLTATSHGKWSGLPLFMPSFVFPVDSLAPSSLCWNKPSCVNLSTGSPNWVKTQEPSAAQLPEVCVFQVHITSGTRSNALNYLLTPLGWLMVSLLPGNIAS